MRVIKHNIVTLAYGTVFRFYMWILDRKEQGSPVFGFRLFKTAAENNVMQGEKFVFEKRQLLDAAGAGPSEDALRASGSVSLNISEGVPVPLAKFAGNIKAKTISVQSPKELAPAPVQIDSKVSSYAATSRMSIS
jgi:hypothetical protein